MFKGKNVNLRYLKREDIHILNEIRNEEEVLSNLIQVFPNPVSDDVEEHTYNERCKRRYTDRPQFVIEKQDGTPIGKCGFLRNDWKNSSGVIWIFLGGAENRGKGYGTEALKLFVSYIFDEMNLNSVRLFVFDFNKNAIRSYEKAGFKVEGVHRQDIFRYGKYNDTIQMSILRSEYEAMRGEQDAF